MKTYTVYEKDSGLNCGEFTQEQVKALGIRLDHYVVRVNEICPQTVRCILTARESLKDCDLLSDEDIFEIGGIKHDDSEQNKKKRNTRWKTRGGK